MTKTILLGTLALAACSETLDPKVYPPIPASEYQAWKTMATWGDLPGHGGNTYRIIYADPIAQTYEGGQYPEGSRLVKEVHDLDTVNGVPTAGALQYVAIMRRMGTAPEGLSDDGGWVFSYAESPGGSETRESYCWDSCHVAAPYHGAWFDYSK